MSSILKKKKIEWKARRGGNIEKGSGKEGEKERREKRGKEEKRGGKKRKDVDGKEKNQVKKKGFCLG